MRWTAPPNRREITLILFSLTIYILSYNLETSLRLLGLDPVSSQSAVLSHLGLTSSSEIAPDGRKPKGWRDKLEDEIFGSWRWDEGHVSGDGQERSQVKGIGRYGALWTGRAVVGLLDDMLFGSDKASDVVNWWGEDIPQAKLVRHVPGYSIIDNAIFFNGTVYLVTDKPSSFPAVELIASWAANSRIAEQTTQWQIVSSELGKTILGGYGGKIRDVTFLSTDSHIHNFTLLALWRTYASLDLQVNPAGQTTLAPPRRLFLAHLPTFQGRERIENGLRTRSETGWHPQLAKAAFPTLGIMYKEDWDDFGQMEVPFIIERAVVADRGAAMRGMGNGGVENPAHSPPLERLEGSRYWWEPIRRTLATYFEVEEKERNVVITYLARQRAQDGPKLREADHTALVNALGKMGENFEVNVINEGERWDLKMRAIVRSTIILGVYGTNLVDSMYMKPSPHTTVMEFFPNGVFTKDVEVSARALGIRYLAWWSDRKFSDLSLPPVQQPPSTAQETISINANVVVQAIRDQISR